MTAETPDRTRQDVGNILALEHVNVRVPDQGLATLFYVVGMGLTRDPYLMVGVSNMWVNVGQQQFHLPTGSPQVLPGHTGLVVPDLDALTARMASVERDLAGTRFAWSVEDKHVTVSCPWGNRIRCHGAGPAWGDMALGIPYVAFPVGPGQAEGVARFYRTAIGARAAVTTGPDGVTARVAAGSGQVLLFHETAEPSPAWDGHHIAVYLADFSGPHRWLREHGLVTEESDEHQYRFQDLVDPDSGRVLFTVEHEVRSATHPMYLRPLINRNPAQRQRTYRRGRDAFVPSMPEPG